MAEHDKMLAEDRLKAELAGYGLNLYARFRLRQLIKAELGGLERQPAVDFDSNQDLLLIANGGPRYWHYNSECTDFESANPIDECAVSTVLSVLDRLDADAEATVLYPAPTFRLSLLQLGRMAGWQQRSPLGLGLHPQYGLWFAYRVVLLIDGDCFKQAPDEPVMTADTTASTCLNCESRACIQRCPAAALSLHALPDMQRCSSHRLATDSSCETRCLAREACPVATEYQYPEQQIAYHYGRSINQLRQG